MEDKELSNFGCILKGNMSNLKKIKEHIVQEYVQFGLVKLITSRYEKNEICILTGDQWREYQKLKKYEDEYIIGANW